MTSPSSITVTHKRGDLFQVSARQHRLHTDQPEDDGGEDSALTPTELFVASLASCVAFYARRYLARHKLPDAGLVVTADYTMARSPSRVAEVTLRLQLPAGVPEDRHAPLLAVASHCTVHNSLSSPPAVKLELT